MPNIAPFCAKYRAALQLPGYEASTRLLKHEACHLAQIEREGRLKFAFKYLWWLLRYGYQRSPYEIEARRAEWD